MIARHRAMQHVRLHAVGHSKADRRTATSFAPDQTKRSTPNRAAEIAR